MCLQKLCQSDAMDARILLQAFRFCAIVYKSSHGYPLPLFGRVLMPSSNPATVAVKLLDRKPPTVFNYAALKVLAGLRHHPYSHRTAFETVGAISGGHGFGRVH